MTFRYRLYPTVAQESVLVEYCAQARFVWNLALEQANMYIKGGACGRPKDVSAQLTELRRVTPWMQVVPSRVQYQALYDFENATRAWWKNAAKRPTWRRAGEHEGFYLQGSKTRRLNRKWAEVWVSKLGWVKFNLCGRDLPAGTKSYRVKKDRRGRWWITFPAVPAAVSGPGTGAVCGVDMGVVQAATVSDGTVYHFSGDVWEKKIRQAQRVVARRKKGSRRRTQAIVRLGVLHERRANARKDWLEKSTTDLARRFDTICVEDLDVCRMTKKSKNPGKRGLNRAILDKSWSVFASRLGQKAPERVERVPAPYTSQRCSVCKHVARESRESQALFRCVACGHTDNADVNAARNIAAEYVVTGRGGVEVDVIEALTISTEKIVHQYEDTTSRSRLTRPADRLREGRRLPGPC